MSTSPPSDNDGGPAEDGEGNTNARPTLESLFLSLLQQSLFQPSDVTFVSLGQGQEVEELEHDDLGDYSYEDDSDDDDYDDDDDDDDDDEDEDTGENELLGANDNANTYLHRRALTHRARFLAENIGEGTGMSGQRRRPRLSPGRGLYPKVPSDEGRKLMDSGFFGAFERENATNRSILDLTRNSHKSLGTVTAQRRPLQMRLLDRELGIADDHSGQMLNESMMKQSLVPSTEADMVVRYDAPTYLGQFSDDGNFFFSGSKDMRIRLYDTSNINDWKHYKTVTHPTGQWTLTDAALSPDNRWLAFSTMMPYVCLEPTDPSDEGEAYLLDLSSRSHLRNPGHFRGSFCIFSLRFSGDGRELITGTNAHSIVVYDIESRTVLHHLEDHEDDVNAVCYGDKKSPHLLYSGSDDCTIKVWDRRSLGDRRPAGAFVGHCEGITYLDSKDDGRYILSNSKDQTMRLWDLRMAMSASDFERLDPVQSTRDSIYDYRFQRYSRDLYFKHPHDNSVVTFRGHRVERTLIRCHFSPPGSSDGRYVYSASHDGKVYVWNLDATLAGVIDVRAANLQAYRTTVARQIGNAKGVPFGEGSSPDLEQRLQAKNFDRPLCVRDASWHPTAPVLVASSFPYSQMERGLCSMHSCGTSGPDDDIEAYWDKDVLFDEKMEPIKQFGRSR